MTADLDVVTIGRVSVDLYGQQIGSRLEDMASFAKSVGGCPANIAIGAARLGLKSAVITRVGNEPMGRFIREQMRREGVDVSGVGTDPERLTALVLLGVRDEHTFPLIFYRERCADLAMGEEDIDPALVARAKAIVVTGTHFSRPMPAAAQRKAIGLARAAGAKIVFDIDYRPNLWDLAGHDAGNERYIASERVTATLQDILPLCDLIVGTEEEMRIAAGRNDPLQALRRVRELSKAVLVLKRGPMGCVVFAGPIPERIEDGVAGRGFPVEVYNVLGAGDAFMAGFLRGWLRGEPLETCAGWANACGAFAVSRLLCSPEFPTWPELQHFLQRGSPHRALRNDPELNHLHWVTTRRGEFPALMAFAMDHRLQLEEIADRVGASRRRIASFKLLAVAAAARVAQGKPGFGMLLDGGYGREALFRAADHDLWIGRPVELPGSRPLRFETPDLGSHLAEWPATQTVKCLCFYHPDDPDRLKAEQEEQLLVLYDAVRTARRELLVEIICGRHGGIDDGTAAKVLDRLYGIGIRPDWWKLEPQHSGLAWSHIAEVIERRDPYCRGILLLGLDAAEKDLLDDFVLAAECRSVKGFAVGRTIFAEAAPQWLAGAIGDEEAVDTMAASFSRLAKAWAAARGLSAYCT
ncbi:MAG: bifunctional 5-dehydro-2-deoxygluconokinase/5-dehydro-2-deoxyphosphogluconate aldolase [Dongiaceae bacterium]